MAEKTHAVEQEEADMTASQTADLESSIRELHINAKPSIVADVSRPIPRQRGAGAGARATPSSTSTFKTNPKSRKTAPVIADSWEDGLDRSDEEAEGEEHNRADTTPTITSLRDEYLTGPLSPLIGTEGPLDPPPTPNAPSTSSSDLWTRTLTMPPSPGYGTGNSSSSSTRVDGRGGGGGGGGAGGSPGPGAGAGPSRRPEKQTAVAGRLIAGALGIRAPKRTEEQRAYDRAVKEQEIRRRNREREEAARAREEEERIKAAVWTD